MAKKNQTTRNTGTRPNQQEKYIYTHIYDLGTVERYFGGQSNLFENHLGIGTQ